MQTGTWAIHGSAHSGTEETKIGGPNLQGHLQLHSKSAEGRQKALWSQGGLFHPPTKTVHGFILYLFLSTRGTQYNTLMSILWSEVVRYINYGVPVLCEQDL